MLNTHPFTAPVFPIVPGFQFMGASALKNRNFTAAGAMFVLKDVVVINLPHTTQNEFLAFNYSPVWCSVLYDGRTLDLALCIKIAEEPDANGVTVDPSINMSLWDQDFGLPASTEHHKINLVLLDSEQDYVVLAVRTITLSVAQTNYLKKVAINQKERLANGEMHTKTFIKIPMDELTRMKPMRFCR